MARVCPKTKAVPDECWCGQHCEDTLERARRKVVGTAVWEWRGGEALHVYVTSKVEPGRFVSLCNLRQAVPEDEEARARARRSFREPEERCLQCQRTLGSRTPNTRMRRYFLERGVRLPAV